MPQQEPHDLVPFVLHRPAERRFVGLVLLVRIDAGIQEHLNEFRIFLAK